MKNRDDVHKHICDKAPTCDHFFMATNTKKTDKHYAVTQMVCQRCLLLINFDDISSGVEKYRLQEKWVDATHLPPGSF